MASGFSTRKVREESAEILIPAEDKISKKLPVFYNPIMKLNRDLTILLLSQYPPMRICDLLAGSGIRAIRFAKELKTRSILANDLNPRAVELIRKNMEANGVGFEVLNKDANLLLLDSAGFDFIDLDVFGSPNFVLDSAVKRIARDGILAVTATDTSALCGTYPKACMRKYWSMPTRTEIMHEAGIRILARKVQLIGAQYDKALMPIFSLSKDHYFRIFFRCEKGKKKVDDIQKKHAMSSFQSSREEFGPLWTGQIWDNALCQKMLESNTIAKNQKLLKTIADESAIDSIFFYCLQKISKREKLGYNPKKESVIQMIKDAGFMASATHFSGTGIRTDMPYEKLLALLRKGRQ